MIAARFVLLDEGGVRLCTLKLQLEDLHAVGAGRDLRAAMHHVTKIIPRGYQLSSKGRQRLGVGLKKLLESRENIALSVPLEGKPKVATQRPSTEGARPEEHRRLLRELTRCRERCEEKDRRLSACVEQRSYLESQLASFRETEQDRLEEIRDLSVSNTELKNESEAMSKKLARLEAEREAYHEKCIENSDTIKDLTERLERFERRDDHSDAHLRPSDPFM